ncbi:hypothetical protein BG52_09650 [Paenibacillus darwinianus]|nr:hypothetical protein CH50_10665 [Paenibacillus darwinianus]EXX84926.1 hypothetical protein BG52_09650 [Paenibacillus darwinianus]
MRPVAACRQVCRNEIGGLVFIEVHGSGTATGIGGLRIGDDQAQALKTLGKPDRQPAPSSDTRATERC